MIEIIGVTKRFKEYTVFSDVTASFSSGEIVGIIGRNGSGKTVLFKCILGLIPVTQGSIKVAGQEIGIDIDMPRNIGVIIETPGFVDHLTGYQALAQLMAITRKVNKEELLNLFKVVGLEKAINQKIQQYSMGMRQRLGIAQAIMDNPDVLILDEPFNGLDSLGVKEMTELLLNLKAEGKCIILASHSQEDINRLCNRVYRMSDGRLEQL